MNPEVLNLVKTSIESAELLSDTGASKKKVALAIVKSIMKTNEYELYSDFISDFIDFLVNLSKGVIKININKKSKYCCI
jgi:hypothetical protein